MMRTIQKVKQIVKDSLHRTMLWNAFQSEKIVVCIEEMEQMSSLVSNEVFLQTASRPLNEAERLSMTKAAIEIKIIVP